MNFFKRFSSEPSPSPEELAAAESFKNILKYGEDMAGAYKDASDAVDVAFKVKRDIEARCEAFVIKDKNLVMRNNRNDWSSVMIRSWRECTESPIKVCITRHEFGSGNPYRDDLQDCLYCHKAFK